MKNETLKLFINGSLVNSHSRHNLTSLNPETNQVLYHFPKADEQDVDRAVTSANLAFIHWSQTPAKERSRILRKAADLLRENNQELALLEVQDTGKPIQEAATVDVLSGADCLEYFAALVTDLNGQHIPLETAFIYTRKEPLGVCAAIGAWNYPIQIACWKSAPALACGNTMVFKPSELTSLTALKLAEIYKQAGLPDGVFNVLTGDGETGEYLIRHPDVAKVSLTGSVATGKKVMALAGKDLKYATMELGGKSPLIIFEDADIDEAVSGAMLANFFTQGEVCSNGTRVFVHEAIHDEFVSRLVKRVAHIKIGSPLDSQTQMGALISAEHLSKVIAYIDTGIAEGAKLLCGGKKIQETALAQGNFIEPTVFIHCHDEMTVVKEEIFGPVMSVLSFKDEVEVIQRANDTCYGLSAGVFSQNMGRAHRVVAQLQAGTCWINNYNCTPIAMPFGGYKQSGIGRENGTAALDHYTQIKSVYVELGNIECPYK